MEKAKSTGNFSAALPHNPEFDDKEEEEDEEKVQGTHKDYNYFH